MPIIGLSALGALWLAAVEAPVTSVTVYSDRARVVRTAKVGVSGTQRVELPLLHGTVDASSIRVEAEGAEVTRVELRPVDAEALPPTEARRLITELERLDDRIAQTRAEREVYVEQLAALGEVRPTVPAEPLSRLDASGWRAATDFLVESTARLQEKLREVHQREESLERELSRLVREARELGAAPSRPGLRVVPTLSGEGPATLRLSYVTTGARWYPAYELRLEPESNRVEVAFSGRVSQESGEDWEDAALTLSTAIPATATTVPKLATWKIGQRERFIPTPAPVADSWRAPPPAPPPALQAPEEDERLRSRLLALIGQRADAPPAAFEVPPPPPPQDSSEALAPEDFSEEVVVSARPPTIDVGSVTAGVSVDKDFLKRSEVAAPVGLSPPGGWRRPVMDPRLPASLAGGYALAFTAQRPETVRSAGGERRVPLFTESWPVQVERTLYPALTAKAFLVAELSSPSKQVLPGGEAQLFVGADPAGEARLTLVSPGEAFTLPLGIDPAVRPVRNVQVVTSEKGLLSKDELTEYLVTIEVANPYPVPLPVRIHDQWPLSAQGEVEVKLVRTEPFAEQDPARGTLEWRLTVPPSEKLGVSFLYTVRHPKGWRLRQRQ